MAGDPIEYIRVVIRGVSWMSRAEQEQLRRRWCVRGKWLKHQTPPTKTDRKLGAAVRTDAKEVGRRR